MKNNSILKKYNIELKIKIILTLIKKNNFYEIMFKNVFKLFLFSIYLAVFIQTLYLLLQSLKHLEYAFPVFLLQ